MKTITCENLDDAIAEAVTTYEQQRDRTVGGSGVAHLGFLAHEMRNLLSTAMLTFEALSRGSVGRPREHQHLARAQSTANASPD